MTAAERYLLPRVDWLPARYVGAVVSVEDKVLTLRLTDDEMEIIRENLSLCRPVTAAEAWRALTEPRRLEAVR